MPNAAWAEWIIARLSDRDRAASIIGDLLESRGEENPAWFWWSVAGVVLSLVWRSLVGFVVAYLCLSFLAHARALMQCPHARGSWFSPLMDCPSAMLHHEPPQIWMPFFAGGVLISIVAPYAVVRYGFRDRFAQLTVALFAPTVVVLFYWWVSAVILLSLLLVLSIVAFAAAFVDGRRALLVLTAALVIGYGGMQLAPHLADWYLEFTSPSAIRTVIAEHSVPILSVAMLLVACNLMHRLLMRPSHQ
jgi:hypothetical protein